MVSTQQAGLGSLSLGLTRRDGEVRRVIEQAQKSRGKIHSGCGHYGDQQLQELAHATGS
jgi:hypothetical protein